MIAVIVPAYNEEACLGACLRSVRVASRIRQLDREQVLRVVVLDTCTDQSEKIARAWAAHTLSLQACNAGAARALGAQWALNHGARWLAFTDADSVVAPDWLSMQLAQRSDAVCGTVLVRGWGDCGERLRGHSDATHTNAGGHQHIHGANLGVSAAFYRRAGGFQPLASREDVALVRALQACGARIAWSAAPRVTTSARRQYRARLGLGATLPRIDADSASLSASG